MARTRKLTVEIAGDSRGAQRAMGEMDSSTGKLGQTFNRFGRMATVAVAGGLAASVASFASFDDAMTQSTAIMTGAESNMEGLESTAREVGRTTRFSAEEAAEGFFFLASAGMDAEASMAALPEIAALATAGNFDLATATDLATDAQSALGMVSGDAAKDLEELVRVGDVFAQGNMLANTSVEQLATAMQKAGPTARSVGMEIEEASAILLVFAEAGLKGDAAGTTFTNTINGLTARARESADEFGELGIQVFDAEGNMRNAADIVGDMEGALGGMSTEQQQAALAGLGFNKQAQDGINLLLGNSEALRDFEAANMDAGGAVHELEDKNLSSAAAKFDLLKSQVADVGLTIGSHLLPLLSSLAGWLSENEGAAVAVGVAVGALAAAWVAAKVIGWVRDVAKVVASLGRLALSATRTGARVVVAVARMTVGFLRLSVQAAAAAGRVVAAFVRMAAQAAAAAARVIAQIALQVARWVILGATALASAAAVALAWIISMGPIILVAAAIAAFVALVVIHFDTIKAAIGAAFGFVLDKGKAVFGWLRDNWPLLLAILTGPFGLAVLAIVRNWDTITSKASSAIAFIRGLATGMASWVATQFSNIVSTVTGMPGRIRSAASGMFDGLRDAFKSAVNAIIRWWNGISFTLPTISIPGFDPPGPGPSFSGFDIGGQTFSTPNIPELAKGGIIRATRGGTLFRGGEGGHDEAVVPLDGRHGMGDTYMTINVNGPITSEADARRWITQAVNKAQSQGRTVKRRRPPR